MTVVESCPQRFSCQQTDVAQACVALIQSVAFEIDCAFAFAHHTRHDAHDDTCADACCGMHALAKHHRPVLQQA